MTTPCSALEQTRSTGSILGYVLLLAVSMTLTVAAGAAQLDEFLLPLTGEPSRPGAIAVGDDGTVWLVEGYERMVARLETDGTFTSFYTSSSPIDIFVGPDGLFWVPQQDGTLIRLDSNGFVDQIELFPSPIYGFFEAATGPGGDLWVSVDCTGTIHRINGSGEIVSTISLPTSGCLGGLTQGSDGDMWYSVHYEARIGRIRASGEILEYPVPPEPIGTLYLNGLVHAADGSIWFTTNNGSFGNIDDSGSVRWAPRTTGYAWARFAVDSNGEIRVSGHQRIGTLEADGTISGEFAVPDGSDPGWITPGTVGDIYFTTGEDGTVGRLHSDSLFESFDISIGRGESEEITLGPDGNLWFTEGRSEKIGRVTPTGVATHFPLPSGSWPYSITAGPEGSVWFTDIATDQIGMMSPAGALTTFDVGTLPHDPTYITSSSEALWYSQGGTLGKLLPTGDVTNIPFPTNVGALSVAADADGAVYVGRAGEILRYSGDGPFETVRSGDQKGAIAFAPGRDETMWFAGNSHEIGVIGTGGVNSFSPVPARRIAIDGTDAVWFTTFDGMISRFCGGQTTESVSLPAPYKPYAIATGPEGAIWITTSRGVVFRLTPDSPPCLSISGLWPRSGPPHGGTVVTLRGTNFESGMTVHFGDQIVPYTLISDTELTVVSPPNREGETVSVFVSASGGSMASPVGFQYHYPFNGPWPAQAYVVEPEPGRTATEVTVRLSLAAPPSGSVVVNIESDDPSEILVDGAAKSEVIFTETYTGVAFIKMQGVVDHVVDGDQTTAIRFTIDQARTTDASYLDEDPYDVEIRTVDVNQAGVSLNRVCEPDDTPCSDMAHPFTSEAGAKAVIRVSLWSRPDSGVEITVGSSDETEGRVESTAVTIDPDQWETGVPLEVRGIDDIEADGAVWYQVHTAGTSSSDPNYDSLRHFQSIGLHNLDDETALARFDCPPSGCVPVPIDSPVTVWEGDPATTSIFLRPSSPPTSAVTLEIAPSDEGELNAQPASLIFTPDNWDVVQEIVVSSIDDAVADGNELASVILLPASSDSRFQGLEHRVPVVILDDEPSVSFLPCPNLVCSGSNTTEQGGVITAALTISQAPDHDVHIRIESSDPTEGVPFVSTITIPAGSRPDWTRPPVTITGVDDDVPDGDVEYQITATSQSDDSRFDGYVSILSLTNLDDESGDFDRDGVVDEIENAGPNGGDGNADGIADSSQHDVVSLPGAGAAGYITISSNCALSKVRVLLKSDITTSDHYHFPLGLIEIEASCTVAEIEVLYHGQSMWNGSEAYRKFGPTIPGVENTRGWYNLPGVTFDTSAVGDSVVARARFVLVDGSLGDDTGVDGTIVDQGGPAIPPNEIPTLSEWLLFLMALSLGFVGLLRLR